MVDPRTQTIGPHRRAFVFGAAAVVTTIVGGRARARAAMPLAGIGPRASTAFGPTKQLNAGVLNIGYVEMGPASGMPILLFHGWPYDIHAFAEVAPLLAAEGYRVIVPYLRGHGTTRFLSAASPRNAQQAALAADGIALMDALGIRKAVVAGFDWGARTADIMAVLWPERCVALVSVSGYLIGSQTGNAKPLAPAAELKWWYQFYFATERGKAGYAANTNAFNKQIWQLASPKWRFDDATFERSAAAFANPDHVAIVIHNYRWRLGLAAGEARGHRYTTDPNDRPEHVQRAGECETIHRSTPLAGLAHAPRRCRRREGTRYKTERRRAVRPCGRWWARPRPGAFELFAEQRLFDDGRIRCRNAPLQCARRIGGEKYRRRLAP